MALTPKNQALAQDFINLKNRVNAMIDKRRYNNALKDTYGSSSQYAYNETDTPAVGRGMNVASVNKIIQPMDAISSTVIYEGDQYVSLGTQFAGDAIKAMDNTEAKLAVHEYFSSKPTSSSVDCSSGCAGLCRTGCGGTCKSSCATGCENQCSDCSDDCGSECKQNCATGCDGICRPGCGNSCTGECSKGAACKDTCTGDCTGCTGSCKGGCSTTCTGSCSSGCSTRCTNSCAQNCGWADKAEI